jgi:thiamine-phosphate pyrophosphorylase
LTRPGPSATAAATARSSAATASSGRATRRCSCSTAWSRSISASSKKATAALTDEPDVLPCRLYLTTPQGLGAGGPPIDDFLALLPPALAAGDVACLRLAGGGLDGTTLQRIAGRIAPLAQARDVAFLVEDDAGLALAADADGLHLGAPPPAAIAAARARLGATRSLGVACGASRHDAMNAAEQGADYVAVEAGAAPSDDDFLELIAWWSELMTVPLVAGTSATPAATLAWARAGADFVALDPGCWAAADPAAAIAAHQQALDRAAAERTAAAP